VLKFIFGGVAKSTLGQTLLLLPYKGKTGKKCGVQQVFFNNKIKGKDDQWIVQNLSHFSVFSDFRKKKPDPGKNRTEKNDKKRAS
jgi:hypothetical protein